MQGKKFVLIFSMVMALVVATTAANTTIIPAASSQVNQTNMSTAIRKNQTGTQIMTTATATPNYNATDIMLSSFNSANNLLTQALNDIKAGNLKGALGPLNLATGQIEQQQLASVDVISNPVLQVAREHLLAAKQAIEMSNTDKAISELNALRQLKLLHQQGMMRMGIPMTGKLNSTFNSAEAHLLASDEAINLYNPQKAMSELNIANNQLYAHQLAMLDVVNLLFNATRTHIQKSINDINSDNARGAISELNNGIMLLRDQEQGALMIKGVSPTNTAVTPDVGNTTRG